MGTQVNTLLETPDFLAAAGALLTRHEGFSSKVYFINGHATVGIGRDLNTDGVSRDEANYLLGNDIQTRLTFLVAYPWWDSLTQNRKLALLDMAFELGEAGFKEFANMTTELSEGDWNGTADQMLASKWAKEVPTRAKEDANLMRGG